VKRLLLTSSGVSGMFPPIHLFEVHRASATSTVSRLVGRPSLLFRNCSA
jgi:hypothetical protein